MSRPCKLAARIEILEPRTLMSGTPLSLSTTTGSLGTTLVVVGTKGNDQITVKQTSAGLVIGNSGGWSTTYAGHVNRLQVNGGGGNNSIILDASVTADATLYAGGVNSTLVAGSGNDVLFGGTGKSLLEAGRGNDTLVSFGSTAATLVGGSGSDSFWTDSSAAQKVQKVTAAELSAGAVHRVSGFVNAGAIRAVGKNMYNARSRASAVGANGIREPGVDAGVSYRSFSNDPIFAAAGPSADDIFQGNVGDCYYLSVLSSTAKIDPARIRDSILDLGDGTVIVALNKSGKQVYVREDEKLPVDVDGSLAYAGFGKEQSTWVALMEKAYCYVHPGTVSYSAIDSGWMSDGYDALGVVSTSTYTFNSAADMASLINKDLTAGLSVTYATGDTVSDGALVADHAYMLDHVTLDSHGAVASVTLRNPWGCDANGDGNGYVTVTANAAFASLNGIASTRV